MANRSNFRLPRSFLTQLGEFTNGYLLVTVNEAGQFEVHMQADSPVVRLGLARFSTMLSDTINTAVDGGAGELQPPEDIRADNEGDEEGPFGDITIE